MTTQAATRVALETSLGLITLEIFDKLVPHAAAAFLRLVDDGSLARDGAFYRAVRSGDNDCLTPSIDIVQGGLLNPPQYLGGIPHESTAMSTLRHCDGTVSLTRGSVGSATGAGFFICVGTQPSLDAGGDRKADGHGLAAFGMVTSGMDVVRRIHRLPTASDPSDSFPGQMLLPPIRIHQTYLIT